MYWILAALFITNMISSNGQILTQTAPPVSASNITVPVVAPPSPVASPPLVNDNNAALLDPHATSMSQAQNVVVPLVAALLPPTQGNALTVPAVAMPQSPWTLPQTVPAVAVPQTVPAVVPQSIPVAVPQTVPAVPLVQAPAPGQNNVAPQQNCVCGVFLSGQFVKGSSNQPIGNPALLHEQGDKFSCSPMGNKQCTNKCLDLLVKHLPNSPTIICGSLDRDCYKERAYLWIQNCNSPWINTNLSAGREYCCKEGVPYKCPFA